MSSIYTTKLLIEQVLPAAGAEVTTAPFAINTFSEVTPLLEYKRNGIGGAVSIVIKYATELDPNTYFQIGEIQSPAIVPGTDVTLNIQRGIINYTSTAAGWENITLPTFNVIGSYITFTLREVGAVGTPGTVALSVHLKGEQ